MMFTFIDAKKAEFPVSRMCAALFHERFRGGILMSGCTGRAGRPTPNA